MTEWTPSVVDRFRWELQRRKTITRESARMWIVWHLPKWIIYWAAIRLISYATSDKYSNTEVSSFLAMDALKRWENA